MDRKTQALFEAVETGNSESLRYLVEQEWACVQCLNEQGQTLLMIAALHGNQEMVKKLIAYGVPINTLDFERRNAVTHAAVSMAKTGDTDTYKEVIEILKQAGVSDKRRDNFGWLACDYEFLTQYVQR